jgi:ATP-dependent DNA helicase RecG
MKQEEILNILNSGESERIVHRDYRSSADSIVKIYDNKIEFINPGGIYGDATIEDIKTGSIVSSPRNKLIASVFKEAGMIEKYGSGIKRVIEQFLKYGLPEPKFENLKDFFKVTVFDKITLETENITQENIPHTEDFNQKTENITQENIPHTEDFNQKTENITQENIPHIEDFNQKTEKLTQIKIQILNLIKQKPDITRNEMSVAMDKSEGLIKYYLAELKKQGFISREGSAKKGRWIITK